MPDVTTCRGYPYPLDTDPINVAGDMQNLAEAIDTDVCDIRDDVDRTLSITSRTAGGASQSGITGPFGTAQITFPAPGRPGMYIANGVCIATLSGGGGGDPEVLQLSMRQNGAMFAFSRTRYEQGSVSLSPNPVHGVISNDGMSDITFLLLVERYSGEGTYATVGDARAHRLTVMFIPSG